MKVSLGPIMNELSVSLNDRVQETIHNTYLGIYRYGDNGHLILKPSRPLIVRQVAFQPEVCCLLINFGSLPFV